MALAGCGACSDLRTYALRFMIEGINEATCNSLKQNTGLNPEVSPQHNNCDDLTDLNACLMDSLVGELKKADHCEWEEFMKILLKNFRTLNDVMVCNECGQWIEIDKLWEEISKIWEEISKIWKAIEDIRAELIEIWNAIRELATPSYTTLRLGTDYTATAFSSNGWEFNGEIAGPEVKVRRLLDLYTVQIGTYAGTAYYLRNTTLAQTTEFRHTNSVADVPASRVYGINFIGSWAFLNNLTVRESSTLDSLINTRPVDARAAWEAGFGIHWNTQGYNVLVSLTSYKDGYNTDWSPYPNSVEATSVNHTLEIVLS